MFPLVNKTHPFGKAGCKSYPRLVENLHGEPPQNMWTIPLGNTVTSEDVDTPLPPLGKLVFYPVEFVARAGSPSCVRHDRRVPRVEFPEGKGGPGLCMLAHRVL
jgi:hypothetical protein